MRPGPGYTLYRILIFTILLLSNVTRILLKPVLYKAVHALRSTKGVGLALSLTLSPRAAARACAPRRKCEVVLMYYTRDIKPYDTNSQHIALYSKGSRCTA